MWRAIKGFAKGIFGGFWGYVASAGIGAVVASGVAVMVATAPLKVANATLGKNVAEAQRDTATCVATHEKGRADASEGVVTALRGSLGAVNAAADRLARQAGARETATQSFLREIANAPKTHICGTSPAELAYRRSVLDETEQVTPTSDP